jgi:hypothetical protein
MWGFQEIKTGAHRCAVVDVEVIYGKRLRTIRVEPQMIAVKHTFARSNGVESAKLSIQQIKVFSNRSANLWLESRALPNFLIPQIYKPV